MSFSQFILLVEDDVDISEAIQSILEGENLSVKSTFNGKEAMDFLISTPILPSLILLDVMMPVMNGYEFRIAQLENPKIANIPTILLSAASSCDNIDKFNFTECLKKPIDIETLIDVVKKKFK